MKTTGIVRPVDSLGRIVLPVELRRTLNITPEDSVEIFTNGQSIVLKKFQPSCVFCGEAENVEMVKGKYVCRNCLNELKKL